MPRLVCLRETQIAKEKERETKKANEQGRTSRSSVAKRFYVLVLLLVYSHKRTRLSSASSNKMQTHIKGRGEPTDPTQTHRHTHKTHISLLRARRMYISPNPITPAAAAARPLLRPSPHHAADLVRRGRRGDGLYICLGGCVGSKSPARQRSTPVCICIHIHIHTYKQAPR